jgi:hypothetical protein
MFRESRAFQIECGHLNWRLLTFRIRFALYGLTHTRCWQCKQYKGLNLRRNCYGCQIKNLMAMMDEGE